MRTTPAQRLSLALVLTAGALLAPAPAAAQQVTKAQVSAAIDRAVTYLRGQQNRDGSFTGQRFGRSYPLGVTAMSVYALLLAGVPADDPAVAKGLNYIRRARLNKTYSVGLAALALSEADPVKYKKDLERIARWLQAAQLGSGMWTYGSVGQGGRFAHMTGDNSNAQFGVLGLWGCKRAGVHIPASVWKKIRDYWRGAQNANGSWDYKPGRGAGKPPMTCAGIASLLIANAQLRRPGPV